MAAITTSNIILPKEVARGVISKVCDTSIVQTLFTAEPRLGSSPRAWGARRPRWLRRLPPRIIPTSVGSTEPP